MYDEDLDALAAEYVLGTLASDERTHAEALIAVDSGFAEIVRQWERRLGELNVMVEAVEPPARIWDGIKSGTGAVTENEATASEALPPILADTKSIFEAEPEPVAKPEDGEPVSSPDAPAAGEQSPEAEPSGEAGAKPAEPPEPAEPAEPEDSSAAPFVVLSRSPAAPLETVHGGADVTDLMRRAQHWRLLALGCGALAAVLAAFIAVSQVKPGFHIPQLIARSAPSPTAVAAPVRSQLVAVLQQDPSAPAFLLTIDPAARTMSVHTVAAKPGTDHSFELWLIGPQASTPRSLGLIGETEYTQRPLPANLDAVALQAATYAVSYEPAGGSKTGAPSGPILFTGKLVRSVPPPAKPAPKT